MHFCSCALIVSLGSISFLVLCRIEVPLCLVKGLLTRVVSFTQWGRDSGILPSIDQQTFPLAHSHRVVSKRLASGITIRGQGRVGLFSFLYQVGQFQRVPSSGSKKRVPSSSGRARERNEKNNQIRNPSLHSYLTQLTRSPHRYVLLRSAYQSVVTDQKEEETLTSG